MTDAPFVSVAERIDAARAAKVARLVDAARLYSVPVEILESEPVVRANLAAAAQVRPPSVTTWALVYATLRGVA